MNLIRKLNKMVRSDYVITLISTGVHAALIFLYGIFVRHFVIPVDYGAYSSANIVLTYLNFLQLGVLNSFNREYPQSVGAMDWERARTLKNTTFTYISIIYTTLGCIIVFVTQILSSFNFLSGKVANGIGLLCLVALLSNIISIFSTKYKSDGRFYSASIINIISTIAQVIVGGTCVYCFGYYGIYIGLIFFSITSAALMRKELADCRFSINKSIILMLIKTGLPLLINGLIWTLIMTSDQFIILYFSDREKLGLYSIAQTIFSVMVLIPQSISQVMYVKLSNYYGREKDKIKLLQITKQHLDVISIVNCAFMMIIYTIMPGFVMLFMPAYMDGINAARILCIGVSIYGGTMVFGNLFTILKKNKQLLRSTMCLCLANIFFSCLLVKVAGFTIELVASGTAISYIIYSLILVANTSRMFNQSFVRLALRTYSLLIVSIISTVAINEVIGNAIIRIIIVFLLSLILIAHLYLTQRKIKENVDKKA